MPISNDIKQFYPDDWDEIREFVLARASEGYPQGHSALEGDPRCEWCEKPNGWEVDLYDDHWEADYIDEAAGRVRIIAFTFDGEPCAPRDLYDRPTTKVVLTIAHLDQDPRGDDPDRLRALCQRCHLTYDARPEQRAKREHIYAELRGQQVLFGGAA